jgi:hypothetical protein
VTARLLFDSISTNTGDLAIGIANAQLLEARGIPSTVVDPVAASVPEQMLIGGGELIRPRGDDFYDAFRPAGRHILHAAGVWTDADDLAYLDSYAAVSARSTREAAVLESARPDVRVLPCSTTLLESPRFDIPGADPGERLVGIHVVPHSLRLVDDLVRMIDAIPGRKVFIPFTHYNGDSSFMANLPFDRDDAIVLGQLSPLELHSVIGQLSVAIVSSLHASIFAYSQNVPFASFHQKKVDYYFADRGLSEHVVSTGDELALLSDRLTHDEFDFSDIIARDRKAVSGAFDDYAAILRADPAEPGADQPPTSSESTERRARILLDQAGQVLSDRDLAIGTVESRRAAVADELGERRRHVAELDLLVERQKAEIAAATARYAEANARFEQLSGRWWVRAAHRLSLVARLFRRPTRTGSES